MKRFWLGLVLFLVLGGAAEAAPRRSITASDLYQFQWVADPQISPDGERVAFVKVTCDSVDGDLTYRSTIWLVSAKDEFPIPRQITTGVRDSAPRWSPNGGSLAFLRPGEGGHPQIWILPLDGGEAVPATDLKHGAGTPHWSPDGTFIAFTAAVPKEDPDPKVRIIHDPEFRANGRGFITTRSQIFVHDIHAGETQQLTEGPFEARFADWSPESSTVFYLSDRRSAPWHTQNDQDLFGIERRGGTPYKLIDIDGPIHMARANPRGQWALVGYKNPPKARSYNQLELLITPEARDMEPGAHEARICTADLDADLGSAIAQDMASPRGRGGWEPVWSNNRESVFVILSEKGTSNLARIDVDDGDVHRITPGENVVLSMSATPDAETFAFVMGNDKNPGDLWVSDDEGKHLRRLTQFNDELLSRRFVSGSQRITVRSEDGLDIDAWLIKPADWEPWNKHPLIVQIHGGPHVAYGEHFFHEFQVLAGAGYMVLAVNPRGSATYGREFADAIQYAYPGGDIYDILAAVDSVSTWRDVDAERLGVTGGSGGGYLTNWIIAKDDRFKAAAAQRSIADWLSFYFTADFSMFTPFWFRKQPWESPGEYIERSPAYFASRINTPLLLIHSENDLRTPVNQAEAMFRALKSAGRPAVMIRFPGEDHNLSRTGTPAMRVARLNYLVEWFDHHLQGRPAEWMNTRN